MPPAASSSDHAIYWLIAGRPYGPVPITVVRGGVRRDVTIDVAVAR